MVPTGLCMPFGVGMPRRGGSTVKVFDWPFSFTVKEEMTSPGFSKGLLPAFGCGVAGSCVRGKDVYKRQLVEL